MTPRTQLYAELLTSASLLNDRSTDLIVVLNQLRGLELAGASALEQSPALVARLQANGIPPFTLEEGQRLSAKLKAAQEALWDVLFSLDRAYKLKAGNEPDTN